MEHTLRSLPRRVFDGFGYSVRSESVFATPSSVEELQELYRRAAEEGISIAHRGSGKSYGDAAMNGPGLVVDMRNINRLLTFDSEDGLCEVEPGFTVEQLWRRGLPDGYWPRVVPGTMFPTLGGCAAMNIHGKNHYQMGGFGDSLLEADLLTPTGELLTLSREKNSALLRAAVSGFGMLGSLTRIKLRLKKVNSGELRVRQLPARDLTHQLELFEAHSDDADYVVGWVDCIVGGSALGRGQVHVANYTSEGDGADAALLEPDNQDLPATIMGVPRGLVGSILALMQSNLGMRYVNLAKSLASRFSSTREYRQGHVAFHFLLDYVPTFRDAYRPGGFIQYQPFVPRENAQVVFREIFERTQRAGIVSYLGVMKRYREDEFLLSHALDGYSMAMDFPVTAANRADLWRLCGELSDLVLEAGGKFYPAKDSVMRPRDFARSYGDAALAEFRRLREQCDPERLIQSELSRRVGLDESL